MQSSNNMFSMYVNIQNPDILIKPFVLKSNYNSLNLLFFTIYFMQVRQIAQIIKINQYFYP